MYQRALQDKQKGEEQLSYAKEQMARLDSLVSKKANEAMKEEIAKHKKIEDENRSLEYRLRAVEDERDSYKNQLEKAKEKIAEIEETN